MKKMLFTAAFALIGFMASAQFMVTADVDFSNDNFEVSEVTDFTDIGVGYFINDTWMVGVKSTNDSTFVDGGANIEGNFKLLARYYYNESIYITADVATEEFADNLRIGAGYSFAAYGSFFIEPNYTFNITEQDGERNGRLNLGLAYKF
ncbi:MAG: hypothetical protein QNK68_00830 [Flavobacteriales bacterium]|tara:strand:+ start:27853 stop:28299 length:447 start_codon:yes stop_codon:yes gene_type:complete